MAQPYFAQFDQPTIQKPRAFRRPTAADLSAEQADLANTDQQETLLAKAVGLGTSGLSIVGNTLDLPGSMVRDTLSGLSTGDWSKYNPVDQLLSPFSGENRATGRELLTNFGITKPNDHNKWELADFGGFGAEMLTDPLFWLPAGSIGRGLSAAKNAIPASTRAAVAGSKIGKAVAKGGRVWNQLFDAEVMGNATPEVQKAARGLFKEKLANRQSTLGTTLPAAGELERRGLDAASVARQQRDVLEGVAPAGPHAPADILDPVKKIVSDARQATIDSGGRSEDLDDVIDYAARQAGKDVKAIWKQGGDPTLAYGPMSTNNPAAVRRNEWSKGFQKGTNHVNTVLQDPEWEAVIASGMKPSQAEAIISKRIERKYGADVLPEFHDVDDAGKLLFDVGGKTMARSKDWLEKNATLLPSGNYQYTTRFGKGPPVTVDMIPKMASRYDELARQIVRHPEYRELGLYNNHWLVDSHEVALGALNAASSRHATYDVLAQPGVLTGAKSAFRKAGGGGVTVGDLLRQMSTDSDKATQLIADRLGMGTLAPDALKALRKQTIREDVAKDLTGLWQGWKAPKEVGAVGKLADSYTAMFKAGVLTWPARYVRDIMSATVRNAENGWFDHLSGRQAHGVLQGRTVEGLEDIQAVQDWLVRTGRPVTPQTATHAVAEMFAAHKATPIFQNTDLPTITQGSGGLSDLLGQIPGRRPSLSASQLGSTFTQDWNPMNLRGVGARTETSFGPAAAGDIIGKYTDDMARLPPFINQLKKGVDPAEAMKAIQYAQVNYDPSTFTKTEQGLKRLLPFYSFTSRQIPYVMKTLFEHPAGPLAQIIKAQNVASGRGDEALPEYLAQTSSIPLGTLPDGSKRFISGFGLMHENPLGMLGPSAKDTLLSTLSQTTPWLKQPLEAATGQTFFQRGPEGGRELLELDPTVGRTISNVSELLGQGKWENASGRAHPFLGRTFEHTIANSPLARGTTTVRALTDPRKYTGDLPGAAAAATALTGVRVSDLSPASQDAVTRELLQQYARENLGARNYESTYVDKSSIEKNRKADPELAARQENFMALQRALDRRTKHRQKEQAAAGSK